MDSPSMEIPGSQMPRTLSGRRTSSASNSPEFEFWMLRNPTLPQPDLLSADELFVDGVLLPLRLLHFHPNHHPSGDPPDDPLPQTTETASTDTDSCPKPDSGSGPELSTSPADLSAPALTGSKRWTDIFKKSDRKNSRGNEERDKEKKEKKERKVGGGGASPAELNINIWPFSRSRSAGNGGTRPRMAATRKVSSAPCSRSNSAGESKSRKWPSSPGRAGVHLGRSSPVWQVRRRNPEPPGVRKAEKGSQKEGNDTPRKRPSAAVGGGTGVGKGGNRARVLNLNVPMCIGYRQHLSCRSDESSAVSVAGAAGESGDQIGGGGGSGDGGRGTNLFNLRSLFTKKVF